MSKIDRSRPFVILLTTRRLLSNSIHSTLFENCFDSDDSNGEYEDSLAYDETFKRSSTRSNSMLRLVPCQALTDLLHRLRAYGLSEPRKPANLGSAPV